MKLIKMMQSLGTELAAPLEASKRLANAHQNNIFFKSHFKNINCDPWTCESERKDGAFPVKLASWKFSFHQHALPISVLGSSSTLKNFEKGGRRWVGERLRVREGLREGWILTSSTVGYALLLVAIEERFNQAPFCCKKEFALNRKRNSSSNLTEKNPQGWESQMNRVASPHQRREDPVSSMAEEMRILLKTSLGEVCVGVTSAESVNTFYKKCCLIFGIYVINRVLNKYY